MLHQSDIYTLYTHYLATTLINIGVDFSGTKEVDCSSHPFPKTCVSLRASLLDSLIRGVLKLLVSKSYSEAFWFNNKTPSLFRLGNIGWRMFVPRSKSVT